MFRALARFWEVAVGSVLQGIGIAVTKLIFHRIVAALGAIIGFLRTLSAIGIVVQVVADTFRHKVSLSSRFQLNDY